VRIKRRTNLRFAIFLVENENKNVENNDNDANETSKEPKIKDFIAAITY